MEKLVGKRYFDVHRDFAVIKDGGFFCQACLIGKDKTAVSSDPRYCQDCYDFLCEALETGHHSAWTPKLLVDEGTKECGVYHSKHRGMEIGDQWQMRLR